MWGEIGVNISRASWCQCWPIFYFQGYIYSEKLYKLSNPQCSFPPGYHHWLCSQNKLPRLRSSCQSTLRSLNSTLHDGTSIRLPSTYGRKSADRTEPHFGVIFFVFLSTFFGNLEVCDVKTCNIFWKYMSATCRKHFGWTCGPILKYHNFDRFYPQSAVFGIFWGRITGFL